MNRLTFSRMLVATGLLTLSLALVSSWRTVPWITYASFVDGGPSTTAPIVVLAVTTAMSLATLVWGIRRRCAGAGEQGVSFPQVLVVVGLLGVGIVGALALWPAFFLSVLQWQEGFQLLPDAQPDTRAEVMARGLLNLQEVQVPLPSGSRSSAYSGALAMQLVAVALPLVVLSEGFRRLLRARRKPALGAEGLSQSQLLAVLALLGFMVACAAAPIPIYGIIRTGGDFLSTLVGDLVALAAGFAVPVVTLVLAAVTRKGNRLQNSMWLPVTVALLVVAVAGGAAADRLGLPAAAVGLPLAGLLWAGIVTGRLERGPLGTGHLLGVVAVWGLLASGALTQGALSTFEVGRYFAVTHGWLIALMAITYAINFGILAAAVWRLQVDCPDEPVPEPETA